METSLSRREPEKAAAACAPFTKTDTSQHRFGAIAMQDGASNPLHLSRVQFALVWIAYLVVSTLNATLTLVFAAIYYGAYTIRGGYMIDSVGLFPLQYIPIVVASYAALALYFWKLSLEAIVGSIRARRLVFEFRSRRLARQKTVRFFPMPVSAIVTELVPFEVIFLLRELIEVSTQSYQVYKCSTLISMQWINEFYVATLVSNCWIAPVIHVRTKHHPAKQRFLYICSDVLLDFASTFVVPVSIISTIVLDAFQSNLASASGDMEYAFDVPMDDVSFSNMVKAVQQVFIVTWLDFVTKLLPFLSMATCLVQIQRYVQPRSKTPPLASRLTVNPIAVHPHTTSEAAVVATSSRDARSSNGRARWLRLLRDVVSVHTVHILFALWGVCIVVFHVNTRRVAATITTHDLEGCKTLSQPWFVDKLSCTVLEINCYRRGFTGHADEIASALDRVDTAGVSSLIISHCPALYMSPQVQTLSNLMWFEIFNATLMEWGDHAAFTNSKLPALQYLNLVRVNMTELPMGLQSPQFPSRLRDITIALSNITTLPVDLHTKWKRMVNLVLERTLIETVPATVAQMNPSRLSVFNNRITHIPDDFFSRDARFWILSVAKNPITAWPKTIGTLDRVYLVLMDYTEIAMLPSWLTDEGAKRARTKRGELTVSAGGTPFCRQRLLEDHANERMQTFPGLDIVCREKADEEIEAYMMSYFQPERVP